MGKRNRDIFLSVLETMIEIFVSVVSGICLLIMIFAWNILSVSNRLLIIIGTVVFVLFAVIKVFRSLSLKRIIRYSESVLSITGFTPIAQIIVRQDTIIPYEDAENYYKPYKMKIVSNINLNTLVECINTIPIVTFSTRQFSSPIYIAKLCDETVKSIKCMISKLRVDGGYNKYIEDNMVDLGDYIGVDITPIVIDICINGFEGCNAELLCTEDEMKYKLTLYKE